MAIAVVGSLGTFTVQTLSTNVAPPFGQATSAGNLLVGWFVSESAATETFSITQSWSVAVTAKLAASTGWAIIAYKANCGAGETAPTGSWTGSSGYRTGQLMEVSGAATVSPVDQIGSQTGTATPITATASAADVTTGELLLGCLHCNTSTAATMTTTVPFNNATTVAGGTDDATSRNRHCRFAYGLTTANASADASTMTSSNMNINIMVGAIASFKVAAAGAPEVIPETGLALRVT